MNAVLKILAPFLPHVFCNSTVKRRARLGPIARNRAARNRAARDRATPDRTALDWAALDSTMIWVFGFSVLLFWC